MSVRLEEVLRHVPLAGAVLDRELRYLAHNQAWLRVHGVGPDHEIVGRPHDEVFPGVSGAWRVAHERCLGGAVERTDVDAFVDAGGAVHQVRWVVTPWRDPDETIRGVMISGDLTIDRIVQEEPRVLAVLEKPFAPAALLTLVRELLGRAAPP